MFTASKIRGLEKDIRKSEEMLAHMVKQTEEVQNQTFSNVLHIKSELGLDWDKAFASPLIQEELFQLLLHKQFIGYLAETVRQKRFSTLKLQNLIASGLEKEKYSQLVEKGTIAAEMKTLLRLFTDETRLLLEEVERKDNC